MTLEEKLKALIRDIPDFPDKGVIFKDITPVLQDPGLCREVTVAFKEILKNTEIDVVAGVESRGFFFGMLLAQELKVPFVPVRKEGKLPYRRVTQPYSLEYGKEVVEMHVDAVQRGQKVLVHDDLLATGGTIVAASELVRKLGGEITGYVFLIELLFLKGREKLPDHAPVHSLVRYE